MNSQPAGTTITTIVVDDHTLFRDGLRELLTSEPDIEVVAEGRSGKDAIALTSQHKPDVVLLDVEMPGPPPRVVIPRILSLCPTSRIIIVTMYGEPELAHELMGLGARGFLVKDVGREQLFAAVRTVMHDDERTLLAASKESLDSLYREDGPVLSAQEQAVLQLAARAMTNAQIGSALGIPAGSIRRHLGNAYRKLGASGRIDAVNQAVAAGLIRRGGGRSTDALPRWHPGSRHQRDDDGRE
ncbi:MAG: response regulator [Micromonosporaceae bacterium]|nr:response regulator [Micromonosporaceae bacterium]